MERSEEVPQQSRQNKLIQGLVKDDKGDVIIGATIKVKGTAIGASYAGNFAVTTTSGPGLALKSEACGLAVMAELPLVIVDVQRGQDFYTP